MILGEIRYPERVVENGLYNLLGSFVIKRNVRIFFKIHMESLTILPNLNDSYIILGVSSENTIEFDKMAGRCISMKERIIEPADEMTQKRAIIIIHLYSATKLFFSVTLGAAGTIACGQKSKTLPHSFKINDALLLLIVSCVP